MRELSLGITNNNLEKIPVASLLDSNSNEIVMDNTFAKKQAGKILLQVENNGEAWYVSPINNRRYFLGRPADALELMRKIGLGITNKDLRSIGVDK